MRTMVDLLRRRAEEQPDRLAYTFLVDGEREGPSLTYGELDRKARSLAVGLQRLGMSGERALLLYPSGLDFIVAFFGCLYAGAVPVPAVLPGERQLPRALPRLLAMAGDAEARLVLTLEHVVRLVGGLRAQVPGLAALPWQSTDGMEDEPPEAWQEPDLGPETIAFLQYTSGSTSEPKGVMVSHGNLLHNLEALDRTYRHLPGSVMVSWLPMFHDMGLIYGILGPLHACFPCYLMSPEAFIARPMRWLEAISRYRGTHSVAPNFAYELCVKKSLPAERASLDLRSFIVAGNGAEPVRAETLSRFAEAFRPSGLSEATHKPNYGLAEGTLVVSNLNAGEMPAIVGVDASELAQHRIRERSDAESPGVRRLVGSGRPVHDMRILIVDPETRARCAPDEVGEIWVAGPSVAQGYWNRPEETERTFHAHTSDSGEGPFMRTGDLGFLKGGQLFITGRQKDMIILRGKNHYPQDIEATVEGCSPALRPGCSAAFAVEVKGESGMEERLAVVAEVDEARLGEPREEAISRLLASVREAIATEHDVLATALCLIQPRTIAKTSSGKIQRRACKQAFEEGKLAVVAQWHVPESPGEAADGEPAPIHAEAEAAIRAWLMASIARRLGIAPRAIDPSAPFQRFGLDSVAAVETAAELTRWVGRRVPPSALYDHPSIEDLARHLASSRADRGSMPIRAPVAREEPIAVVAMACRFPGGVHDPESFWRLLDEGVDAIREVPADRWEIDAWYDPDPDAPGKMTTRWGGFLDEVDRFEPELFGISPREAVSIDPQQRLLLETSWEALERAGQTLERLSGSDTGVYMGVCASDYQSLAMARAEAIDAYSLLGTMPSTSVGRLSYWLGLKGPNVPVDTACSSSLVAVHLACQALRTGECSMALAGGVNLVLRPEGTVYFSRVRAMSPTGRCRVFSADADGYVRSEGCGVVVLKRLSDARRDGDPIVAVIRGSAVNQDGRSNGLTAPHGPSQEGVIRRALGQAGVLPAEVGYLECHGTGTPLGDPIEVQALAAALGEGRAPDRPVALGSVKSNIGHTEGAAGVAGLIKAVLSLQHERIPKSLHVTQPNPHVAWAELPVKVAVEAMAWPRGGAPRFAGVSSFGFGGTNAHVVVEEAPAAALGPAASSRSAEIVVLSAKSAAALAAQAARLGDHLASHPEHGLGDVAFSLATTRSHFEHRLAVTATSREALRAALEAAAQGQTPPGVVRDTALAPRGRLAFLFTGQGAQVPGMGRGLHEAWPAFREAFDRCAALFDEDLDQPLCRVMWAEPGSVESALLDQTAYTQPSLFTLEYALFALWRAWGVTPDLVGGHSIGEITAACVAGVFSLEDAVRLVAARGRLMAALPTGGAMVSIAAPEAEVAAAVAPRAASVSIAAVNGPSQVVIAGVHEAVEAIAASFEARGARIKRLVVSHAFHSPAMDPMLEAFRGVAESVAYQRPSLPLVSSLTGSISEEIATPSYWVRHVREAVRFAEAVKVLHEAGAGTFVELGPKPALLGLVQACLPDAEPLLLASLRGGHDEPARVLDALGGLWAAGGPVHWAGVFPAGGRRVPLPTYPWQRERYWIDVAPGDRRLTASDWFYRVEWPETPRARTDAAEVGAGPWLILADRGGVGEAAAALLSARGHACTVLQAPVDASSVAEGMAQRDWQGVLYLGGLDAVVEATASAGEVGEATRRATSPVIALARALGAASRAPRLWVVTRGACAVGGEPEIAVCQAALWGLCRVAALEHPNAWGGLVDLDPEGSPSDVEALVAELLGLEAEDQIAFRQGRRHAARLVAAPPEGPAVPVSLSAEGTYLVTGGLGALGLLVARWLVERGARHLVLTSRHGLPDRAITAVEALRAQGAQVTAAAVDVADVDAMTSLLSAVDPPLAGVFHLAGLLDDGLLAQGDEGRLARVLRPKVEGAWVLHTLTRELPLQLFVLFSSLAGVVGSIGQGAYAAANAFLDGLAQQRRAQSLPALSVAWGMWAEGGMSDAQGRARLADIGVLSMPTAPALSALERLVGTGAVQRTVTRMDWARFAPAYAARGRLMAEADGTAPPAPARAHRSWRGEAEARPALLELVRGTVARALGFQDAGALDPGRGFAEQGLDSLMAVEIRNRLQGELGVKLSATLAFDHPTVERLVSHLLTNVLDLEGRTDVQGARSWAVDEPIALVGAACRFPGGAEDLDAYWRLLAEGRVATTEVPPSRWNAADWYDPDPEVPGRTYVTTGGFLRDVEGLDSAFFRISPREAASLDPQQRLLLEVGWEALEQAGFDPTALRESPTGVFVGVGPNEYAERLQDSADDAVGLYRATGSSLSFTAGRLSFVLGLHGPSLAVDTACSSSLVALHLGCQSLRQGECDRTLVGAVNVLLSPRSFVALSRLRALAPDGRCKTFSASADGYARAEGCAVVVLKRLRDAQRDGDRILAVIRGTAINHDGPSSGLTVPNGPAQQALLRQALAQAGVAPAEVDFVECHGTGTALGDPIEVQALGAVYGQDRPAERPLVLGAAKANLGHLEPASGLAGLLKVVLALQHEQIPAQPNLGELNPHLPWDMLPVAVAREAVPWPRGARPRRAGVSAFGLSGTNAHVVLEEAPLEPSREAAPARPELVVLSAKSEAALSAQAARLREHLTAHPDLPLGDVAFSLATTRSHFEHRLAVTATSREALLGALSAAALGQTPPGAVRGRASAVPKVVFVFPGQGSQWVGMGRKLLAEEPAFRAVLSACDEAIQAEAGWSLLAELAADETTSRLDRIEVVQPVLFAIEVALAALWRSWGVTPDAVVGHSMGEVAAAYVAGALSLGDAVAIICRRSLLLRRIRGQGEMAVVELSAAEAEARLLGYEDRLSVAVSNSPRSTVIAGEPAALGEVLAALESNEVFCRRVKVDVASHSPQVDPLREELVAALSALRPQPTSVPMRSTVTGAVVAGPELGASYWADNLRRPVRFADAVQALLEGGHALFVEMSPHPILAASVDEIRRAAGRDGASVGSLRRGQDTRSVMLEALGASWAQGRAVAWERLFPAGGGGQRVSLPTYPWQRERYWIEPPEAKPRDETAVLGLLEATDGADFAARLGLSKASSVEASALLGRVLSALQAKSREVRSDVRGWFYTLAWRPQPLPSPSPAKTTGRWVILVDAGGTGDRVADALEAAGATCARVRMGTAFEQLGPDVWSIDTTSPASLAAWWSERLATWGAALGVVHCWSLGEAPRTVADVNAALRRGAQSVLGWVQALVKTDHLHRAKLWLMTSQAVSTGEGDRVTAPEQAPLWGLGRVIASERPDLFGGLIDLPEAPTLDPTAAVSELLAPARENQVALRAGGRFVPRLVSHRPAVSAARAWSTSGTALITGGLGALGLHVARWLARQGVKHLVLVSRRGTSTPGAAEAVASVESLGASVTVAQADVADAEAMAAVVADIDARLPPLSAVFHAAGVLDDGALDRQDASRFEGVLSPKVLGGWNLHLSTQHRALDAFVLFSSLASLLGSPGQGSYAAGNAFLDALAEARRAAGLPAQSVNWGAWGDGGMMSEKLLDEAERRGAHPMRPEAAMQALSLVLSEGAAKVAVADMDWTLARPHFEGARWLLSEVARPAAGAAHEERIEPEITLDLLRATPLARRTERLAGYLRTQIAEVVGMHDVSHDRTFLELGMDSLMMNRVLVKLRRELQFSVFPQEMFDHPSVDALSRYLARELEPAEEARATGEPPALPIPEVFSHLRAEVSAPLVARTGARVPGPAFVLSSPRSGSTLLRVMLAGHSRLLSPPELHLLSFETMREREESLAESKKRAFGEGLQRALMELRGVDADASAALVKQWAEEDLSVQEAYRRLHEMARGRLLVDKSPSYVSEITTLMRAEALFEGARYIQLVRHPYSVIESIVRNRMHRMTASAASSSHNPFSIAEQVWARGNRNMLDFFEGVPPERRHFVRYEDMMKDPERAMRALCAFLAIPFEEAMLDPYRGDRMTDGVRPESDQIGDPNFHTHDKIDPELGEVWTKIRLPHRLGEETRRTAAELGYDLPFDAPAAPRAATRLGASSPLSLIQPEGRARPFFCVPGIEGNILSLVPLAQHLGRDRPFYGLCSDDHPDSAPRIEDTAARYVEALRGVQPEGPYLLGGWSYGGAVAFEMAQQLSRAGQRVALVAILDTRAVREAEPAPGEPEDDACQRMTTRFLASLARGHDLAAAHDDLRPFGSDEQLEPVLEILKRAHLLEPLASVEDARRFVATLTARLRSKWRYTPEPYAGPLVLFRAQDRRAEPAHEGGSAATLGWAALSSQPVTVHEVPGNHFSMLKAPHVEVLANHLRRCLLAADAHPGAGAEAPRAEVTR